MSASASTEGRIAILIIGHANPETFKRLVAALRHPRIAVFAHIDARSDISAFTAPDQDNLTFVADRIANDWASFTQIEVALRLLRDARAAGPFASHAFISADSLPLVDNEALLAGLIATPTAIQLSILVPEDKNYRRVRNVYAIHTKIGKARYLESHLDRCLTEEDLQELQRAMRSERLKRDIRFEVYKGPQWFCMSRAHVNLALDYIEQNPNFVEIFRYALIPDELFFHSVLKLVDPTFAGNFAIMSVDWHRKPKPFVLRDVSEAELIFQSDSPFFRKFCDQGIPLVDAVLERRRTVEQINKKSRIGTWKFLRRQGSTKPPVADVTGSENPDI